METEALSDLEGQVSLFPGGCSFGDSPEPSRTQLFRLDAHWGKLEMFPQSYMVPLSPVLQ